MRRGFQLVRLAALALLATSLSPGCEGGQWPTADDAKVAAWPLATDARVAPPGQHYNAMAPKGWRTGVDQDVTVFAADFVNGSRTTIAIRSAPRDGAWETRRSADAIVPATRKAIAGMAEVKTLSETVATSGDGVMSGTEFDFTYVPASRPGLRYERRQIVLVGAKRVFHILHTGRVGALDATDRSFREVVASLREEI